MCAARADPGELLRVHRHSDSVARALERPASGFSACRECCVSACLVAGCGGGVSRGFLLHDLRTYGFTDPPPSLPVPRAGRETRIYESSWCRAAARAIFAVNANSVHEHAYPCCKPGGKCCPALGSRCCRSGDTLRWHRRQVAEWGRANSSFRGRNPLLFTHVNFFSQSRYKWSALKSG